jgi:hypothetical protein
MPAGTELSPDAMPPRRRGPFLDLERQSLLDRGQRLETGRTPARLCAALADARQHVGQDGDPVRRPRQEVCLPQLGTMSRTSARALSPSASMPSSLGICLIEISTASPKPQPTGASRLARD